MKKLTPDAEKAMFYVAAFSYDEWKKTLRSFFGSSAETMIAQEAWEGKYDKAAHPARFERINENWNAFLQILEEELPTYEQISQLLNLVGISSELMTIGVDSAAAKLTFHSTKDIRNKYVLSHLAWDLGIIDDLSALL